MSYDVKHHLSRLTGDPLNDRIVKTELVIEHLTAELGNISDLQSYASQLNTLNTYKLVFEKLNTESRVEKVWSAIRKRDSNPDQGVWDCLTTVGHCMVIGLSPWEKLTKAKRKKTHKKIETLIKRLIRLLKKYEKQEPIYIHFAPDEKSAASARDANNRIFRPFLERGSGPRGNPQVLRETTKEYSCVSDFLGGYFVHWVSSGVPKTFVDRHNKNEKSNLFIRRMNAYFMDKYDTPLHNSVAILAACIFDDPSITENRVISSIRHLP